MSEFTDVSPGEVLRDDFLEPLGITYQLAKDTGMPLKRIQGCAVETDVK